MRTLVDHLMAISILKTPAIIDAFKSIDRRGFVQPEHMQYAYEDAPLPLGHGQTISQPTTVAIMLEELQPQSGNNILDIGAGSGWTSALLAHIVGKEGSVRGVELIPELVQFANENLGTYGLPWASVQQAERALGLPEHAPYDRILVSAASEDIPQELIEQLAIGGTMVIPVQNDLVRIERISAHDTTTERLAGFAFVPLIQQNG